MSRLVLFFAFAPIGWNAPAQSFTHHSLIIDEVYPDPTPSLGLPSYEYIEIKNNTAAPIELRSWKVSDGSSTATITVAYSLPPDSMVILCPTAAASAYAAYGTCIGLTGFPSLNNESDQLYLIAPEGNVIHAVAYDLSWYGNSIAAMGGHSLEMIDTRYPCSGKNNWLGSTDPKGGTPGKINTVSGSQPDQDSPQPLHAYADDPLHVMIVWNETLDSLYAREPDHYSIEGRAIKQSTPLRPLFNSLKLELTESLEPGKRYSLTVPNMRDCAGNKIPLPDTLTVGLFEVPALKDVVCNELLFDPSTNRSDYIEFYNRSNRIINLQDLYIANRSAAGLPINLIRVSEQPQALLPGSYIVLTEQPDQLGLDHPPLTPFSYHKINPMPTLPDDRGDILLLDRNGKTIDALHYEKDWHYPLLRTTEGVALERIDPDGPTQERYNWSSAASVAGFGTPGKKNSQFLLRAANSSGISVYPQTFSPDNDGFDDRTGIYFELDTPGILVRIRVYDSQGWLVATPWPSSTLPQKGVLWWDGTNDQHQVLAPGRYIFFIELIRLTGKVQSIKKTVLLARRS
ncbi:MAG: hypothetical protein RL732_1054 [Bacteroidota bacterium]